MPLNSSIQSLFAQLIDHLADAISARSGQAAPRAAAPSGRTSGRLCPVPGCGKPGAGPRNRWFCKDHAASLTIAEQKRMLSDSRSAPQAAAPKAAGPKKRGPSKRAGVKLDMHCRAPGCPNESRGPRFGFFCEKHRKELSKAEQQAAREKYNAKR